MINLAFNKKTASLLLAVFFFVYSHSQEAEKIYHEQYSKLSFVLQPSILKKSDAWNRDGSSYPSMEFTNDFSYQFGFYYNFAQSGSFNFKTGVIAKEFIAKFDLNITNEDIGYGIDYLLAGIDTYNQFVIAVPFKTEYYRRITPKLNLVFGAGVSLNLITGLNEPVTTSVTVYDYSNNYKDIFFAKSEGQNSINFSTEISAGLNYKTKFVLFDLSVFYNRLLGPEYLSGTYLIYNLTQSPNKTGDFVIENNYYGLSLAISPKKGWLKRKF